MHKLESFFKWSYKTRIQSQITLILFRKAERKARTEITAGLYCTTRSRSRSSNVQLQQGTVSQCIISNIPRINSNCSSNGATNECSESQITLILFGKARKEIRAGLYDAVKKVLKCAFATRDRTVSLCIISNIPCVTSNCSQMELKTSVDSQVYLDPLSPGSQRN